MDWYIITSTSQEKELVEYLISNNMKYYFKENTYIFQGFEADITKLKQVYGIIPKYIGPSFTGKEWNAGNTIKPKTKAIPLFTCACGKEVRCAKKKYIALNMCEQCGLEQENIIFKNEIVARYIKIFTGLTFKDLVFDGEKVIKLIFKNEKGHDVTIFAEEQCSDFGGEYPSELIVEVE